MSYIEIIKKYYNQNNCIVYKCLIKDLSSNDRIYIGKETGDIIYIESQITGEHIRQSDCFVYTNLDEHLYGWNETELNEREREHIIRVDFFKFPRIDARYKEEIYESRYGENINI